MISLFFDIIIVGFLGVDALLLYFVLRDRQGTKQTWAGRHRIASGILILFLTIGWCTIFYGSFIEPHLLVIRKETVESTRTTKPIRIALVADLHVGSYKKSEFVKKVAKKIIQAQPDVVFFLGDFTINEGRDEKEIAYLDPLALLQEAHIPSYAVLGNHEYGVGSATGIQYTEYIVPDLEKKLKELGISLLRNSAATLSFRDESLYIYGIDDIWSRQAALQNFDNPSEAFSILLTHNPDIIYMIDDVPIDLVVSGHTHGGQIRLPFIGAIGDPGLKLPRTYFKGLSTWGTTLLSVTSGAGESGPRARLFNPPEIVLLSIQ